MLKRLSVLLTLLCLSAFGSRAATVSGTLTNLSLSAPASGQLVYLLDSVPSSGYLYLDSTYTNSSGAYSFTVSSSISSGLFRIMTYATCNYQQYFSPFSSYSGSNLTFNLSICAPITVTGTVSYTGPVAAAGRKVYLVDTNYTLGVSYRDSTVTNSLGQYSFTVPTTINMYRVYVVACTYRWNSPFNYPSSGNATINLTLGCSSPHVMVYVLNSTTASGVLGQTVYLLDSTATHYHLDSLKTDYFGMARFTVSPSVAPGTLRAFTNACGVVSQTFAYTGNDMTGPTLSVCLSNAVVSGTVTNVTTSGPAVSQTVFIIDSTATARLFIDSTYTSSSGYYSLKIPMSVPSTGTMIAVAQACGIRHTTTGTYSGSSMTLNMSVCASSAATVSGIVSVYGTGAPIAGRKVYLVDTNWQMSTVNSRDSTVTNSAGFYSFSIPASVLLTSYRIGTPSCGNLLDWQWKFYNGYSIVQNFSVCNTTGLNTVSGTLINSGGIPLPGAYVYLNSSVNTTTNSSGAYTLTIPASIPLGGNFTLNVSNNCGSRYLYLTKTGSNIVRTDTLYKTFNWCNTISGTVTKQNGGAAASAKVYLIGESYDSSYTPFAIILQALDSTTTNAAGQYSFIRNWVWPWAQRIKAALQPSDPAYWNYLPTYHDSALVWSSADTFGQAAWTASASNMNVSLRAGTNPGGPGFIGGNVLVGANKSTSVGDPLAQRILLLTTDNDVAVAYAFSDASGAFSFPNLPYGKYKLFGDAGGKTNPPLAITLSASASTVNNVVFEENIRTFAGHVGNVGVATQQGDGVHLYPNPAGAYITLNGISSLAGAKTVVVRNVAGAVLYSVETASGDALTIPTEKFAAGIYMVQIHTAAGVYNLRFAKN